VHAHLFEFEDQDWYPSLFRDATTLYLETVERVFGAHRLFAPKLLGLLQQTGARKVVDLGSGGGGPVRGAVREVEAALNEPVEVTLTDLHPNRKAAERIEELGEGRLKYLRESVDASNPPPGLPGVRSMFAFFHHLRPEPARAVLANAHERREPICIFEITDPSLTGILSCVMMPIYVLLLTPFVRPLTGWQLFFTYVIPLLPLLIAWDGFVSTLRTYSAKDLRRMTADLHAEDYAWDIGTLSHAWLPLALPYVIGTPLDS
jgi:hypothetical protein